MTDLNPNRRKFEEARAKRLDAICRFLADQTNADPRDEQIIAEAHSIYDPYSRDKLDCESVAPKLLDLLCDYLVAEVDLARLDYIEAERRVVAAIVQHCVTKHPDNAMEAAERFLHIHRGRVLGDDSLPTAAELANMIREAPWTSSDSDE
jgi:hypothetical protein